MLIVLFVSTPAFSLYDVPRVRAAAHARTFHLRNRQEAKGLGDLKMAWRNPGKPGGSLPDAPTYDMILTVDAVHDMARPDQVLPLIRKVTTRRSHWP